MEGAVGVGAGELAGELAAIGIAERHRHGAVGEGRVIAAFGVGPREDSLVAHELAGAVDAAVGQEDEALVALVARLLPHREGIGDDLVARAVDLGRRAEEQLALRLARQPVGPVGVGDRFGARLEGGRIAGGAAHVQHDLRPGHRQSRDAVDDVPFEGVGVAGIRPQPGDEREPAHPHHRRRDDVVVGAEVVVGAGDHPPRTGGKIHRRRHVVRGVAEIGGGGKIDGEGLRRLRGQELRPVAVVEPLPLPLAGAEPGVLIGLHDPDVDPGEVPVAHAQHRPCACPHALREEVEAMGVDLADEIAAELAPGRVGMGRRRGRGDGAGLHHGVLLRALAEEHGE